jgi:outer membrane protein OmpA-like peptidoglycan-associated protein
MNILAGLSTDIIYFDFDSSIIRDDAKPELNKIIAVMNKYKDMIINIESHTDSRGSAEYNEKLSSRRAKSTYDYFIEQGIKKPRITSHKGFGEYQLTNDCGDGIKCDDDQHQKNRRTEFVIEKMK